MAEKKYFLLDQVEHSENGARVALEQLARELRDNVSRLVSTTDFGDGMLLRFQIGTDILTEEAFVDRVVSREWDVREALEDVLAAYIPEARARIKHYNTMIGEDEFTPALAHIVRGLIEQDSFSEDLLVAYFEAIDWEHDAYIEDNLTKLYAERIGWPDRDKVQFGLRWAAAGANALSLDRTIFYKTGLVRAASTIMDGDEFARLLIDALRDHVKLDKDVSNEPEAIETEIGRYLLNMDIFHLQTMANQFPGFHRQFMMIAGFRIAQERRNQS